jgi:hypothetical protein
MSCTMGKIHRWSILNTNDLEIGLKTASKQIEVAELVRKEVSTEGLLRTHSSLTKSSTT